MISLLSQVDIGKIKPPAGAVPTARGDPSGLVRRQEVEDHHQERQPVGLLTAGQGEAAVE